MRWFQQLFSRRRRYHELHESIQEHLEEKIEDLVEDGMSRENAEQTARRQPRNLAVAKVGILLRGS
jgi:putative ABC transport system permease protein